jgi:hypothetical protein
MLANKVLEEVVLAITNMTAFIHFTLPPLQATVTFVLVPDPIRLPLE